MARLWFKSETFEIEEGEEAETNPLCFGRQLATWLSEKLADQGYETEVVPEGWGWCVVCSRQPFLLWIGCVNIHDFKSSKPTDPIPKGSDVVWSCQFVAEPGFLDRLFRRQNTQPAIDRLVAKTKYLLENVAGVHFVEQP